METFHWAPRPGLSVASEPKVKVISFGDGYEQRQPAGINNKLDKYTPVFRVLRDEAWIIEGFLEQHGSVTPFLWTPPYLFKPIKVVCRKWASTVQHVYVDISCNFDQVIA